MGTVVGLPQKLYFRIGEVARELGVKPHVIRFWEKEFKLRPKKSATNQRIFSHRDVERLRAIKHLLKDEHYTIEGARKSLQKRGLVRDEAAEADTARAEALRTGLLATRTRLTALLAALDAAR
jgi:DNA-binding transcriptional MerR regulator